MAIRKALYEGHEETPEQWELHKQTVIENIYGVDIVAPAVEIAKLRLWLSIISEVDPERVGEYDEDELALPNVVFNVRQGNSLIGYTDLMETGGDGEQARLSAWGPDSVRQRYGTIISKVSKHKHATTTEEAQRYLREAEALLSGVPGGSRWEGLRGLSGGGCGGHRLGASQGVRALPLGLGICSSICGWRL